MSIRAGLGTARREILSSLNCRSVSWATRRPVVSFSFDDFPRSAYSVGGAILEAFGARGTYYASAALMGTTNELGQQFGSDDLSALLDKGHELASHTFNHISSRAVSCPTFLADVKKGEGALEDLTGTAPANFAYPFGHVTLWAKKIVGAEVASARSIFPGFNGPKLDLNLLRANSLYGGVDRSRWARELIEDNARQGTWLIFYTHDVQPNPSPYGCTAPLLEAAVRWAAQSGSRILTVNQALAEVGVQVSRATAHERRTVVSN